MSNSLGLFVQEQMTLFGWSRDVLADRSGLDRWTLEAILDAPALPEWPDNRTIVALARAFSLPVRDVVLHAAEATGLPVSGVSSAQDDVALVTNEDLIREMRRRLALGARMGGYLASVSRPWSMEPGTRTA